MSRMFLALGVCLMAAGLGCRNEGDRLLARGNVLRNQGQLEAAVQAYRDAAAAEPERADVRGRLAETLYDLGRLEDAREAWEAAVERDPESPGPRVGLARIALDRGEEPTARRLLDELLADDPENLYARMSRANLRLARDAEGAVEDYAVALQAEPRNTSALYGYGTALLATGDLENARAAYEKLERLDPDAPYGAYALARLAATEGDTADALRLLREAVRRARAAGVPLEPAAIRDDRFLQPLAADPELRAWLDSLEPGGSGAGKEDAP